VAMGRSIKVWEMFISKGISDQRSAVSHSAPSRWLIADC